MKIQPKVISGIITVLIFTLIAILAMLPSGCTTIQRDSVAPDGTKSTYVVNSLLNSKSIAGLRFKDCDGCVELSLTNYTSNQDEALRILLAALEAYLATKTP